jgi:hypothetical protein
MAIRLTFDVLGSTCGDLLRFADAVRAAGAQPGYPLQQGSGPNRIEVVVDAKAGPDPYPGPQYGPAPMSRPGPMRPPPQFRPPYPFEQPGMPGAGFAMSGSFPPGFHTFSGGRPHPGEGCTIEIHHNGLSRAVQVPTATVDQWRTALDTVLDAGQVDESTRTSLLHLREIFDAGGGS